MEPFSKTIAVYGSSAISQDSHEAQQAEQLGKLLTEAQFKICNGGYTGVMEACSRGAHSVNGQITGVICAAFTKRSPNPYLTDTINTNDLIERITTLMRLADAYIVLDGSIGTMAELLLAWNLVVTGWDKPVLIVGDNMKQAVLALQEHTEIKQKQLDMLTMVDNIDDAAQWIENYFSNHK